MFSIKYFYEFNLSSEINQWVSNKNSFINYIQKNERPNYELGCYNNC